MRKFAVALVVLLVLTGALGAQELYLVNETEATLYLVSTPAEADTVSLDPQASYRQVPPGGVLPIEPDRAVVGFAFSRGEFQLPTFSLAGEEASARARAAPDGRRYIPILTDDLTRDRVVSPSEYAGLLSEPRIDNQYLDWVGRDPIIARGRGRAPLGVYADFGDGREPIGIADSLLWQRGGTDLQWVKAHATRSDFFLGVSTHTAIARGTTLFLYIYGEDADIPLATLEFRPWQESSFVLLWTPAEPVPSVVGNLVATQFFFEAQVWRSRLERAVGAGTGSLTVETATASSAAGIWEEFVLARDPFGVLFGE